MHKIFSNNLKLITKLINTHLNCNRIWLNNYTTADDLLQELLIHVNHNINKFDPEKGELRVYIYILIENGFKNIIDFNNAQKRSPHKLQKKEISIYSPAKDDEDARFIDTIETDIKHNYDITPGFFDYFPEDLFSKIEKEVINKIIYGEYDAGNKSEENARGRILKKCKKYIEENPSVISSSMNRVFENNFKIKDKREKQREYNNDYYEKNKEKRREYRKQYRLDNIERFKKDERKQDEKRRERKSAEGKIRYEINKKEIIAKNKRYYEKNKERCRKKMKEYQDKNKEEILAKNKEKYRIKRDRDI